MHKLSCHGNGCPALSRGEHTLLQHLGSVTIRNAQTLAVLLYDHSTMGAVSKAITDSPLGFSPREDDGVLIVPLPVGHRGRDAALMHCIFTPVFLELNAPRGSDGHSPRHPPQFTPSFIDLNVIL